MSPGQYEWLIGTIDALDDHSGTKRQRILAGLQGR